MFKGFRFYLLFFTCSFLVLGSSEGCQGQKTFGNDYLVLQKEIAMPGVVGRIDHIDVDVKNKIAYVAALGNNTLEIVDLQKGKIIHQISGLDEPQGVAYIPRQHEIFVANGGNGKCYFFNAFTFQKTATIDLGSDADDVRYDSASAEIYVGYGSGGLAVIDARTHRQIGKVPLPAHPESFQLDPGSGRLFVNVPDAHMIAVINADPLVLMNRWHRSDASANFPMALDLLHQRVLVGYRSPAMLEINSENGHVLNTYKMVNDADDLYYDPQKQRIYVSGGGGYINIFQREDSDNYLKIANIPTRQGARTSYFVPSLQLLIVAARATTGKKAALMMYKVAK